MFCTDCKALWEQLVILGYINKLVMSAPKYKQFNRLSCFSLNNTVSSAKLHSLTESLLEPQRRLLTARSSSTALVQVFELWSVLLRRTMWCILFDSSISHWQLQPDRVSFKSFNIRVLSRTLKSSDKILACVSSYIISLWIWIWSARLGMWFWQIWQDRKQPFTRAWQLKLKKQ